MVVLAVFGTVAACVAYLALARFGSMEWVFRKQLRQGAELIDSIEAFRRQNGRLPTEAEADPLLLWAVPVIKWKRPACTSFGFKAEAWATRSTTTQRLVNGGK
jgi:type II secretory pathway pseudopilin PulG